MFRRADRIQEVCSLAGLTVVLGGAKIGARAFSSQFAEGDTCYACVSTDNASEWEVSLCSYATGNLTRGAVISSSNNDAQVAFAAGGNHTVTLVAPASKDIALDPAGNIPNIPGNVGIGGTLTVPTIAGNVNFTGAPTASTPTAGDNDTSLATTAFVHGEIAAIPLATYALLASPTFTGDPKAPTPATSDNDTSIATTAFVKANITAIDFSPYAPLASPTFTGDPKAPTPATADNDTSIATTAFVKAQGYTDATALAGYAPLDSPAFTGDPRAPTVAATDNDTSIATTAFVQAVVAAAISATPMIPAGIVWDYAGLETSIPAGWYLCDGSLKSRTGDARLFAAIGTTYNTGGEAADQFRLPDFRGRVRAMVDKGAGRLTGYNLGTAGGAETHTLTAAQMPTHTHADSGHNHGYSDPGHNHGLNQSSHQHALYPTGTEQGGNAGCGCTGGGGVLWDQGNWIAQTDWRQSGDYNSGSGIGIAIATNYANLANTGGGTAHPNVQPTLAVNAIIKA